MVLTESQRRRREKAKAEGNQALVNTLDRIEQRRTREKETRQRAAARGDTGAPTRAEFFTLPSGEVGGFAQGGVVVPDPEAAQQRLLRQQQRAAVAGGIGGAAGGQGVQQFGQQARLDLAQQQLGEAGAFEEVTPTETTLQPPLQAGEESFPVVGRTAAALAAAGAASARTEAAQEYFAGGQPDIAELFPFGLDDSTREIALVEIKRKSFQEGITKNEAFGSFVESVPVFGDLAAKYVGDLIEAPSSNADNVVDEMNKIKEAASTGQEKVRNGLEDPDYGLERARQMEEDLAQLEGRLRLLINTSPILRANSDEINKMQEQLLEAQEKVARYRRASSFGLTAQLTGTGRIIPTDEQIFVELRRLNKEA